MKKLIIASTSTIHGSGYLEYIKPTLINFFKEADTILFIPYARPGGISYDEYTDIASDMLNENEIGFVNSLLDKYSVVR